MTVISDVDKSLNVGTLLGSEFLEHKLVVDTSHATAETVFLPMLALLEVAIRAGGKILLFGNGGSASDAQHIAAELVVRYKADRPPIAAISLATDTSAMTACANDLGYDRVFARQVEALGRPGDVAVGISTSGRSTNVLAGLQEARKLGLITLGFSGGDGGQMTSSCDLVFIVPSHTTARIQEMHILFGHILCVALERRLGLV